MSNSLIPMQDIQAMGAAIAKSGLFGIKTADQAVALMLIAQAEGRHPAIVARDYDIINGRPAKKSEAMLRDFLEAGGKVDWKRMEDDGAEAVFYHPQGAPNGLNVSWDRARAKKAGLASKDMYAKYERQMYAARVISEGCRRVYPACTSGMYEPGEVRQMTRDDRKHEKDMGAAEVVTDADDEALKAIEQNAAPQAPATSPAATAEPPAAEPAGAAPERISVDQQTMLADMLREAGIKSADAYAAWRITKISELPAAWYKRAVSWISEQKEAA